MHSGYLIVETHSDHPGMVRIRGTDAPPTAPDVPDEGGPRLRYAARFNDLSAARMHAHAGLKRRLLDLDAGLYRSDPVTAISVVESIALGHRKVYLDPDLAQDEALTDAVARRESRHRLADRFWQTVGMAAVLYLILKLLFGF